MSENRIISFIHDVRTLDRKWKNLTADQKRAVLETLGGEADEPINSKGNQESQKELSRSSSGTRSEEN